MAGAPSANLLAQFKVGGGGSNGALLPPLSQQGDRRHTPHYASATIIPPTKPLLRSVRPRGTHFIPTTEGTPSLRPAPYDDSSSYPNATISMPPLPSGTTLPLSSRQQQRSVPTPAQAPSVLLPPPPQVQPHPPPPGRPITKQGVPLHKRPMTWIVGSAVIAAALTIGFLILHRRGLLTKVFPRAGKKLLSKAGKGGDNTLPPAAATAPSSAPPTAGAPTLIPTSSAPSNSTTLLLPSATEDTTAASIDTDMDKLSINGKKLQQRRPPSRSRSKPRVAIAQKKRAASTLIDDVPLVVFHPLAMSDATTSYRRAKHENDDRIEEFDDDGDEDNRKNRSSVGDLRQQKVVPVAIPTTNEEGEEEEGSNSEHTMITYDSRDEDVLEDDQILGTDSITPDEAWSSDDDEDKKLKMREVVSDEEVETDDGPAITNDGNDDPKDDES